MKTLKSLILPEKIMLILLVIISTLRFINHCEDRVKDIQFSETIERLSTQAHYKKQQASLYNSIHCLSYIHGVPICFPHALHTYVDRSLEQETMEFLFYNFHIIDNH